VAVGPLQLIVAGHPRTIPPTQAVVIGRGVDADIDLAHPQVSRRHVVLEPTEGGWTLTDTSTQGTFVAGRRVEHLVLTGITDVALGGIEHGVLVTLVPREPQPSRRSAPTPPPPVAPPRPSPPGAAAGQGPPCGAPAGSGNTFEVRQITVRTSAGKTLLHDVSFALAPESLLAVIGPTGAGKSTLLGALVGSRPADDGEVRYAGRDLYDDYEELRHSIALVPQDDVLHTSLTARAVLDYAARLRFSADKSSDDRSRRIDDVLRELKLTGQADQRITELSGGQRKRTSVALELLTEPSLLFLDEPTSGLDPDMDRSVMETLRELAAGERTVVVVTHNVANLGDCDRLLVLAEGGWVAYFGPPAHVFEFFRARNYAEIFRQLKDRDGKELAEKYCHSPANYRYVRPLGAAGTDRRTGLRPPPPGPRRQSTITQLAVLCRRYLAVIVADRQYVAFLIAVPFVLSLLARIVPGDAGLSVVAARAAVPPDPQPGQLLLVLVVGGALMGAAASVREIVKERAIYLRERATGLSLRAYLGSKVVVLVAIVAAQSVVFTLLALLGRDPPDDPVILGSAYLEVLAAVTAVAVVTMLVGLLVSALIRNADHGMPLLVLLVMVSLVFSGGLFPVVDRPGLEQLAWLVPARWAFAQTAVTSDLGALDAGPADALWTHSAGTWIVEALVLSAMGVALVAATALSILRTDPHRERRPPAAD